jgi:hypothetical protein
MSGHVRRKGSYGIDAPYLLPVLAVLVVANVVNGVVSGSVWPFLGAAAVLACAGCGLYTWRRGKFVVWAGLLEQLRLRGDERILDLGCGRGAVLLLAAGHLTTGRAVGGTSGGAGTSRATRRRPRGATPPSRGWPR